MFREITGWHLAHLTAFRAHAEEFRRALAAASGIEPPAALYRAASQGDSRLIRLCGEQYWWISDDAAPLARLARELLPEHGAVTILSAARVCLRVEGAQACELLAKGIAIDLHPEIFVVGQSAQTGLHHTGILLERTAPDAYDLFVPRTFATTIREWLADASLSCGVCTS